MVHAASVLLGPLHVSQINRDVGL